MLIRRICYWIKHRNRQAELLAEIEAHIDERAAALESEGWPPADALAEAKRRFGNPIRKQEESREVWIARWWADFVLDLRHGLKMFASNPAFAAAAILTLALGIGANTAIFSVIKAVLLEPLPYRQSDRIVHLLQNIPAARSISGRASQAAGMNLVELFELQKQSQTVSVIAAYDTPREVTLGREEPVRIVGTPVSASLFPMLGVQPFLGRSFTMDEERPLSEQPVILSYPAWLRYFAGDSNVLNQKLTLDGRPSVVVGVMPGGFEFPNAASEFWTPLDLTPPPPTDFRFATPIARLKDGIGIQAAAAEATTIIGHIRESYPPERADPPASFEVLSIKDEMVRPVRSALLVLTAAVAFVLLIACSNVANLLLARGTARQGELAIRAALGAGHSRLIRQTITESLLLGLAGGTAGLGIAAVGLAFLTTMSAESVPRIGGAGMDFVVLVYTIGLGVFTSLLFGLIPSVQLSRESQTDFMKRASNRHSGSSQGMRNIVVVAETAMAVVLLIGGVLLIRSFIKLANVDPGFDPGHVLGFQVALPNPGAARGLTEQLTEDFELRLRTLPGIKSVAFVNALPLIARNGYTQPRIEGTPLPVKGQPEFREVSPNYFATMGLRIVSGRGFIESDGTGQPRVAVINQAMAQYFAKENPIGRRLTLARESAEIVGIVNNLHEQGLNVEPRPQVYIDSRQSLFRFQSNANALSWAYFVIRCAGDPKSMIPSLRSILAQMIPGSTLKLNAADMEQVVSDSMAQPRLYAILLGLFGAVALMLAMIGVYGVTAYSVSRRTREMGIRIALGATPREVLAVALRQTTSLAIIGILLGFAAAAAVTRYMQGMLFGLTPMDPLTFAAVPAAFAMTAFLAAFLPARRATKVDPLIALRYE
jgi:putative ABC transport system permease protein